MADSFVHLHVASGFSMRYGTAMPEALIERAVALGQPALGLTDRDGLYGAVRFTSAAMRAGIAPVLGVDLAFTPTGPHGGIPGGFSGTSCRAGAAEPFRETPSRGGPALPDPASPHRTFAGSKGSDRPPVVVRRSPVRGGAQVDPRLPRVTVLARGRGGGLAPGVGWGALCRLVTDTHLRGERGTPVTTPRLLARWAAAAGAPCPAPGTPGPAGQQGAEPTRRAGMEQETESGLVVLLGPDSDVGRALLAGRGTLARQRLEAWRALLPRGGLVVEVVHHGAPIGSPGSRRHAAALLALADACGVPAVLSTAARHLTPADVRTVDVLDAARRLVALDSRHLDRVTDGGHLADTATMHARALELTGDPARAAALLEATTMLALECAQDGRGDLGIGSVHLPEKEILGIAPAEDPQAVLAARCRASIGWRYPGADESARRVVEDRLDTELAVIAQLGYPTYFLAVAQVTDLIREMGVRVAARGSGAGSLVNHLLGISGVDPIRHDLLMERFCSPLRAELPDIDIDVESARRTEIYERVLAHFGGERVTCVSMMDTYRVRHAVRDVGAALGMPPVEIDEIATAFPHIRARDARHAIADLPELRNRGLGARRLEQFFELVEALDGLPRHIALHPCGIILSHKGMLDRTPVEASWLGFPMSQFDKDDVETMGFLKLDVLGIRMQSAMAYAIAEVARVDGVHIDLDDERQVPHDDEATYRMIRTTHTLGCFQIESPGQRELIGKLAPERFGDLITDISLFRPGPVKSDMITPFLESRHGWRRRRWLHPSLIPSLAETEGVVVYHEQVLRIIAETTGVSLAQADEVRRTMGTPTGQAEVEAWWRPAARARGYRSSERDEIWEVLASFASFGFCKAHAAAFALPTYHSAWLKTHHPAAFLAGVLTHDPGMYPKRLILDDARSLGITVLGLDVNSSGEGYRVERLGPVDRGHPPADPDLPDGSGYGIRLSLADVKGISAAEVARIVAGQPFSDLGDFWERARVSRPIVERLVLAGAFDAVHGIGTGGPGRHGRMTRRDLLLHVAELERWHRCLIPGRPGRSLVPRPRMPAPTEAGAVAERAAAQSRAARSVVSVSEHPVQLLLDLGDRPELATGSGLPELTGVERVRAELDVLGLDASAHVVQTYAPMLRSLGVVRSVDLLSARSRSEIWVAGVKVATQTPPIRSGRRVVFLTLDDGTGPADCTFFEDVQGPYAATVFHSWLLLVRGIVRRTGDRGVSVRATGAWELSGLWSAWQVGGLEAVRDALTRADATARELAAAGAAAAGDSGLRRVLRHASGFAQSPYADTRPPGRSPADARHLLVPDEVDQEDGPGPASQETGLGLGARQGWPGAGGGSWGSGDAGATPAPRRLWHASPGSSGH